MPKAIRANSAPPSFTELRQRAEALVPVLRERAAKTEALRRLPEETIADLHRSGLFRMLQPARVGGSELPYAAMIELGAIIARGCGSTAWVLNNLASHHWMLGYWPKAAQDEIWGPSPDTLIGSAFIFPGGRARKVKGGYRLSGRWPFSSGIDPSAWTMIAAVVPDEQTGAGEYRVFLVPASDYSVVDTWYVSGLAGTGSKDVVVTDVLVPEHRTLSTEAGKGGEHPGRAANPGTLFRLPWFALFGFVVASVSLGIAKGAIEQFVAATRGKLGTYTGRSLADFSTMQVHVAEAGALTDAAEAVMLRDCEEATAFAEAGQMPPMEDKVRWRRDGAYAARLCGKAVDIIFTAAGGGAIYESNPLQRAFRDIHAANGHFAVNWDANGINYGRVALGLPPDSANL
ncbi:MAG TPA: acyl-CoA dehydrogenase family protein [Stellaceae bacterium]|nr:acyl-CoA dehydrogenase family protein [Stellaceae bacterium]